MAIEVRNNPAASRLEAVVDGQLAHIDYELDGAVMRVDHTSVPPALEGRGIASELARAAFEHARAEGLKVDVRCSYVKAWVARHPEVDGLIAKPD